MRTVDQEIGPEQLIEWTCNPALTGFTLPKLLWVRENEPDVWSRVRSVLLPKDYVRFRLTGDKATDVSDASGTLLLNVAQRKWSDEMLSATEISPSLLPRVYESPEILVSFSSCFRVDGFACRHTSCRRRAISWRRGWNWYRPTWRS